MDGEASVLAGSDEMSRSQCAVIAADKSRSTHKHARCEDIPATMQGDQGINFDMKVKPYRQQDAQCSKLRVEKLWSACCCRRCRRGCSD